LSLTLLISVCGDSSSDDSGVSDAYVRVEYRLLGQDYGQIALPSNHYGLISIYDDNSDTQVLLDRTERQGPDLEANDTRLH
jgi:hypothetical protein